MYIKIDFTGSIEMINLGIEENHIFYLWLKLRCPLLMVLHYQDLMETL